MLDLSTNSAVNIPVIGLTGGMGSGKTTVGHIFESLSIPRWDADKAGHDVFRLEHSLREQVLELFGNDLAIFHEEIHCDIDRRKLGERVFQDPDALHALNQLVHPAVGKAFETWYTQQQHVPYVLREVAILFESQSHLGCQAVITVSADQELRVSRVNERDGLSQKDIEQRMANQWTDEQRAAKADFVVHNNSNDALIPQVIRIHRALCSQFQ